MLAMATETAPTQRSGADTARRIDHVVVIGANGAMGYGGAALFTTAVGKVTMLARTRDKARQGLEAAVKLVRSSTVADRVEVGSYDEDLEAAVARADLVYEAVTEDLALKDEFFARVDAARRPDSIVSTVTSGLSINRLCEGRSESFKKNFLGLHLFNPPNVIVGTELIAGAKTDPGVVDFIEAFCTKQLGRVIIRTSDTPGFAGNRVGFKVLNEVAQLAEARGPLLMDRVVGPYTGRALAPLATVDLVGWDIHRAIVDNIWESAPDEARATLKLPQYMASLIEKGTLGNKSGSGFFAQDGKTALVLDPARGSYRPASEVVLPDLGYIDRVAAHYAVGDYAGGMKAFATAEGDEADLARKVVAGYVSYAFHRVGEVTESISGIDLIMGFGFNWAPPSVLVDTLGLADMVSMIERAGLPVPALLADALASGRTRPFFDHPHVNVGKFFVAG